MAGQILATSMLKDMKLVYTAPADSGITDVKLIVSTYSKDTITLYAVGAPGWQIVGGELQWIATGVAVTEEERRQRTICVKSLEQYERLIDDGLLIGDEDQIWGEAKVGTANVVLFGDVNAAGAEIETLKGKVLAGTATAGDKEKLMLLTGGAYNYNVNNCSCP